MSTDIVTELFVPKGRLSLGTLRATLDLLFAAGFAFAPPGARGGRYWRMSPDVDLYGPSTLGEALRAYETSEGWGIDLWKRPASDVHDASVDPEYWATGPTLSIHRGAPGGDDPFDTLSLAMTMPKPEFEPTLAQEFLAWSTFLAEVALPWYGWGGDAIGLLGRRDRTVTASSVAALEPQPLEWLNIFGAGYVQRLGLERLRSAPAWRVEFLVDGSIAVTLGPHPHETMRTAVAVADHLGVPGPEP
jgi:hypothetical protein